MVAQNLTDTFTANAEANMDQYLRVKHGAAAGGVALAGDEAHIGTLRTQAFSGKKVGVIKKAAGAVRIYVASGAISAGDGVTSAAGGKVASGTGGVEDLGTARTAAAADGDYIEVYTPLTA